MHLHNSSFVFGTVGYIRNPEGYQKYVNKNVDILRPYNARFLARFGQREVVERESVTPSDPARCASASSAQLRPRSTRERAAGQRVWALLHSERAGRVRIVRRRAAC